MGGRPFLMAALPENTASAAPAPAAATHKPLIDLILELNPNVQIILTTHSPAVIMNGWADRVTEVSDITDNQ